MSSLPRSPDPATGRSAAPVLEALRRLHGALARLPRAGACLAAALWMAGIWWLSSGPRHFGGSGPAWGLVGNLGHAPVFGVLAVLLAGALEPRGLASRGRARVATALLLAVAWGITDECHQSRVPGREASAFDVVTDAAGAASALWLVAYAGRSDASERGARGRALAAAAACLAAAAAAL